MPHGEQERGCVPIGFAGSQLTTVRIAFPAGHDLPSLLFALMDEFLFRFSAEDFMVCPVIKIVEFDRESFKIKVEG